MAEMGHSCSQHMEAVARRVYQCDKAKAVPLSTGRCVSSLTDSYGVRWPHSAPFRELMQNFEDGIRRAFKCQRIEVTRSRGQEHAWDVRAVKYDETLFAGSIEIFPTKVTIRQMYAVLGVQHLDFASHKKNVDAGCFGEGFKVGNCILLRRGFRIIYEMEDKTWLWVWEARKDAQGKLIHQNMVITERLGLGHRRPELVIRLECADVDATAQVFNPVSYLPLTDVYNIKSNVVYRSGKTEIIHVGAKSRALMGAIYHRNMYVMNHDALKALSLSINTTDMRMRPSNRDRSTILNVDRLVLDVLEVGCIEHGQLWKHFQSVLRTAKATGCLVDRYRTGVRMLVDNVMRRSSDGYYLVRKQTRTDTIDFIQMVLQKDVCKVGFLVDPIDTTRLQLEWMCTLPVVDRLGRLPPEERRVAAKVADLVACINKLGSANTQFELKWVQVPIHLEKVAALGCQTIGLTRDFLKVDWCASSSYGLPDPPVVIAQHLRHYLFSEACELSLPDKASVVDVCMVFERAPWMFTRTYRPKKRKSHDDERGFKEIVKLARKVRREPEDSESDDEPEKVRPVLAKCSSGRDYVEMSLNAAANRSSGTDHFQCQSSGAEAPTTCEVVVDGSWAVWPLVGTVYVSDEIGFDGIAAEEVGALQERALQTRAMIEELWGRVFEPWHTAGVEVKLYYDAGKTYGFNRHADRAIYINIHWPQTREQLYDTIVHELSHFAVERHDTYFANAVCQITKRTFMLL